MDVEKTVENHENIAPARYADVEKMSVFSENTATWQIKEIYRETGFIRILTNFLVNLSTWTDQTGLLPFRKIYLCTCRATSEKQSHLLSLTHSGKYDKIC